MDDESSPDSARVRPDSPSGAQLRSPALRQPRGRGREREVRTRCARVKLIRKLMASVLSAYTAFSSAGVGVRGLRGNRKTDRSNMLSSQRTIVSMNNTCCLIVYT